MGGNEGVAEVVAAGSKVKNLTIGDWVIPDSKAFGIHYYYYYYYYYYCYK